MATDTETLEPEQIEVDVPNEKGTPLWRFIMFDHKLVWLGLSMVPYYAFLKLGQPQLVWGLSALVAILGLNIVLFWIPFFDGLRTTLSAWMFRTGTHQARHMLGKTSGTTEDYERGHIAVHAPPEQVEKQPIPHPEMQRAWIERRVTAPRGIGRIVFSPTDLGQEHPMGWVRNNNMWTTTSRTEWYPWSPADTGKQLSRLTALGQLCNLLEDSSNGIIRLVLRDRTVVGEHFDPKVDFLPYVEKNLQRRRSIQNSNGDLPELALGLAAMGIKHYSSMTIGVKKRRSGAKVPDSAISDFDTFYKGAASQTLGVELFPLSHNQLVFEFLQALDPVLAEQNWDLLQEWVARKELLDPGIINPPTWEEQLKSYRCGDTWHSEWIVQNYGSDGKMPPDNLWRLVGLPIPKMVTTVIEITPMSIAKYFTEKGTTAAKGRHEERASHTGRLSGFDEVDLEQRLAHERALARGRGMQSRSLTYVDFTGPTQEEASANAAAAAASVRHSDPPYKGILLRPLTGTQADGLGVAAPLALGLRSGTFGDSLKTVMQSNSSAE